MSIGSPLETVRFIWPRLFASAGTPLGDRVKWDNFFNPIDLIASALHRFGQAVTNHPVVGGGFVRSHTLYEQNATFLRVISTGLFGAAIEPRPGRLAAVWRFAVAAFESLGAVAVLVFLAAVGVAVGF